MSKTSSPQSLDRYTQIGELAENVRWLLGRSLVVLVVLLGIGTALLAYVHSPGTIAFGLISAGTVVILAVWRQKGIGLPILPVLAVQHLIAYGLPVVIGHEVVTRYSPEQVNKAGLEVFVFSCCLAGAWRLGMEVFRPSTGLSYGLQGLNRHGPNKLLRLGFGLIIVSTAYSVLRSIRMFEPVFEMVPDSAYSVVIALVSAAAACGFFLVSMFFGFKALSGVGQAAFWGILLVDCLVSACGYLLSPAMTNVIAVLIGLFWSSGRPPWRFITIVVVIFSFLNLGKYTMRDRYWNQSENSPMPRPYLTEMPASYAEWFQASAEVLLGRENRTGGIMGEKAHNKGVSLLERINNLQNLLFVMDAQDSWHIPPLGGKTYALIPPLLVPRFLWPEKPRAHEGQVLLNVHFGRQDMNSTFKTYIAWGLLPEAYGNFGPFAGAIFLGICLGGFFAWLENFTAKKLLLSLEGFISFTLLLGMASSYEMVASVLVTALFQAVVVIVIASAPFIERVAVNRPPAK